MLKMEQYVAGWALKSTVIERTNISGILVVLPMARYKFIRMELDTFKYEQTNSIEKDQKK